MFTVVLPELGENIEKATISYWYFKVDDDVTKDEDLVELTTDKATFNLACPCSGTLSQILLNEGDEVRVGQPLAEIQEAQA